MASFRTEERDNGLLFFTITREEKRNAINYEVMDGLKSALEIGLAPHIKGIVITGEGDRAFCSGGDLSIFQHLRTEEEAFSMLSKMGNILYELVTYPKPTVALMNGIAVGGGCELATACDLRIAKKGIKAGFVQGTLAITTGWGGGSILLEKLPLANGMKMLFEAKKYTAEELYDLQFVHYLVEETNWDGLQSSVGPIFQMEESVLSAYKQIFIRKWQETNLKERMDEEIRKCALLWSKDIHHEKVAEIMNGSKKK